MTRPLRILIVSAEVAPLASTGELGRSVGGLATALKGLGKDVRVVMPKYRHLRASLTGLTRLVPKMKIQSMNRFGETAIYRDELPGEIPVYLIEKDKYFDRDDLYGTVEKGYDDNAERFSFFNICALEMFTQIGFYPNVVHCHDWHSGLIPAYLQTIFRNDPLYKPVTSVFTIHDLIHQGNFGPEVFNVTGLPDSVFTPEGLEFYGGVSFLKSGLIYSDILNTESKRYSQEIQTPEYGFGFEGVFQQRKKDLYGIVNGVDYKPYNPRIDPFIAANYTKDEIEKKQRCKQDLLEHCGFSQPLDKPVIGMITPLEEHKGIDLVMQAMDRMLLLDLHFVYLNDDILRDNRPAKLLNNMLAGHHSQIRCYGENNEELKHKILAGADMLLVPSKSEPCGVIQMYALKYGTIPFVHATGGLDDTIIDFNPETGKGNGFKFEEYTPEALLAKLHDAVAIYNNPSLWRLLQTNAMRVDYSWTYTARKYLKLYKHAMGKAKVSPVV